MSTATTENRIYKFDDDGYQQYLDASTLPDAIAEAAEMIEGLEDYDVTEAAIYVMDHEDGCEAERWNECKCTDHVRAHTFGHVMTFSGSFDSVGEMDDWMSPVTRIEGGRLIIKYPDGTRYEIGQASNRSERRELANKIFRDIAVMDHAVARHWVIEDWIDSKLKCAKLESM